MERNAGADLNDFFNMLVITLKYGQGQSVRNDTLLLESNMPIIQKYGKGYSAKPQQLYLEIKALVEAYEAKKAALDKANVVNTPNATKTASQKENTMQTNPGTEMDVRTLVQEIKEHPEVLKSIPDDDLVNFLTQHAGAKASLTKAVSELEKGEGEVPGAPETTEPSEVTPEDAQSLEGNPAVSQKPVTASDLYPATDTKHENINKMYDSREVDRTKDHVDGRDILPGNLHAQVQEAFYSHGRVDEAQLNPKEAAELSGLFE